MQHLSKGNKRVWFRPTNARSSRTRERSFTTSDHSRAYYSRFCQATVMKANLKYVVNPFSINSELIKLHRTL